MIGQIGVKTLAKQENFLRRWIVFSTSAVQGIRKNPYMYRHHYFGTKIPRSMSRHIEEMKEIERIQGGGKYAVDLKIKPCVVALIGRPNVGKSSLYNTIVSGTKLPKNKKYTNSRAIVSDLAGTTRDIKVARVLFGGLDLEFVDTGGLMPNTAMMQSPLLSLIKSQVIKTLRSADLVLFLVDAQAGITENDVEVASFLKSQIYKTDGLSGILKQTLGGDLKEVPVVIVANKSDGADIGDYLQDCYDIGFGDPVLVSAIQYEGLEDLHSRISQELRPFIDFEKQLEEREIELDLEQQLTALSGGAKPLTDNLENEMLKTEIRLLDHHRHEVREEETKNALDKYNFEMLSIDDEIKLIRQVYGTKTDDENNIDNNNHDNNNHESREEGKQTDEEVLDEDTQQLYAVRDLATGPFGIRASIDSTMHSLPPTPPVQLVKWIKNRSQQIGIDTSELMEHYQITGENSRSQHFDIPQSRLDITNIERYLALQRLEKGSMDDLLLNCEWGMDSSGNEDLLPWESDSQQMQLEINSASNEYLSLLPENPFLGEYVPINAKGKRLKKNTDRRDAVMRLRRQLMKDDIIQIAIVGTANSGKSTLVNALTNSDNMIVSEYKGTTTDAIGIPTAFNGKDVRLVDTAGIKSNWRTCADQLTSEITMQVIRTVIESQIIVLVLDATQKTPNLTPFRALRRQEVDLLGLATKEHGKIGVVVVNKWDLVPQNDRVAVRQHIMKTFETLNEYEQTPIVFISAKNRHNLTTLVSRCLEAYERWHIRIPTGALNRWLQSFVEHFPPPWYNQSKIEFDYIVQMQVRPPLFVLYSNVFGEFPRNYLIQIKNYLIEEFGLYGTPIRVLLRTTRPPPKAATKKSKQFKLIKKYKRSKPYENKFTMSLPKEGRKIDLSY